MTKKLPILLLCLGFLAFLVYWAGVAAPTKEVISKKQMRVDDGTQEIVPIYSVYCKWNGKEQEDPQWVVFKKYGKWRVLDLSEVKDIEAAFNQAADFNGSWVYDYGFSPQPSRYQSLMMMVGFQPTFTDETHVFNSILEEWKIKSEELPIRCMHEA